MFILMGVSWLLEIFAYLAGERKEYIVIFVIINAFNSFQGLIIFVLLIMTKKNIPIIKEGKTKLKNTAA